MENRRHSASLIVALVAFTLPGFYLLSYCLLVVPEGRYGPPDQNRWRTFLGHYHYAPALAPKVFWPLERIDQTLRPDAWPDPPIVHPPL